MRLLKHGASLGVKDMYGGRQPTFFADPIFRKAFAEKRKELPETTSSPKKRKRGQAEEEPGEGFKKKSGSRKKNPDQKKKSGSKKKGIKTIL